MSVTVSTPSLTGAFAKVGTFVHDVVATCHKEAALVMGVLTLFGVTPVPVADDKFAGAVLLGYAGLTHAAEQLGIKLPSLKSGASTPAP